MKKRLFFWILGIVIAAVPSCVVDDITDTATQVLERINTLEEQTEEINNSISDLEDVDRALAAGIDYLKGRAGKDSTSITVINGQIRELQKQDSAVNVRINELRAYAGTLVKDAKDWASGTFATLTRFDSLCVVVTTLGKKVDSLDTAHTAALNRAVENLETSMKQWVNKKLTDYYTIAQTDAKLNELSKADTALRKELDVQKQALADAKTDITTAYTRAISTAVNTLEGKLNDKISKDIDDARKALQSQIDAIDGRVTALENEMKDVLSRIQSISVVPDLSDGGLKVVCNNATFEVRLAICPTEAAQKIANSAYMNAAFEMVETETKTSSTFKTLEVKGVKYEDELLKLTVSTSGIPQQWYSGDKHGFARVSFTNDKYQKASDFFPLTTIYYPTSISVEYGYYCILPGEDADMKIIPIPSYSSPVSIDFSSSDSGVVSVDGRGRLEGIKAGEVTITASVHDVPEVKKTCTVAVSPLSGRFSIAADKKVVFSPGYLRARKGGQSDWSNPKFFFASHQRDVLRSANLVGQSLEERSLADEIDLFGWSAEGANAKWGISTSIDNEQYAGSFRDWGQNIGKGWKTMNYDEWKYLTETRPNASSLFKVPVTITVNSGAFPNCIVIAPDDFDYTRNPLKTSYTESEIEQLGLVALFSTGYRYGRTYFTQDRLQLWTANSGFYEYGKAHHIYVVAATGKMGHEDLSRFEGNAVRLVREVK